MLDVYVGYDPRETVAYHVACQSILERCSQPVRFTPLSLATLGGHMRRPRHPLQSTDFSFSCFLVPFLSNYQGWSLYIDCDMLARADIAELFALREEARAVMVCQHDYTPKTASKFLSQAQAPYARKNWSSLMLFNNARCRALTEDYVNSASGLDLHQFKWLADDDEIGALPLEWNWLVGEYGFNPAARLVHFTLGGPYFPQWADCDYAEQWRAVRDRVLSAARG